MEQKNMAFTTRKTLLEKVRSGDEISWSEFYETYKPLIFLCGNDCHLTPDENEELLQKVMCEIFQKDIVGKYDPENIPDDVVFKYDPAKGRFRHYLRKIVHYQAIKIYHKRTNWQSIDDESSPAKEVPSEDQWEKLWNSEWRHHVLNMALFELKNRVQPETYAAFEMYALQDRNVQEVATFLNISVSSVYTAKSRCITTLKEIIANLEDKE